ESENHSRARSRQHSWTESDADRGLAKKRSVPRIRAAAILEPQSQVRSCLRAGPERTRFRSCRSNQESAKILFGPSDKLRASFGRRAPRAPFPRCAKNPSEGCRQEKVRRLGTRAACRGWASMEPEFDGADEIWRTTLVTVRERVTARQYEQWFKDTRARRVRKGFLEVRVPNLHVRDWLAKNYTGLVETAVSQNTGWSQPEVRFVLDDSPLPAKAEKTSPAASVKVVPERPAEGVPADTGLVINKSYTFDTFVVGPHNEIAVA